MCDDFMDDGIGWEELGMALALGEEIAEKEKNKIRAENDSFENLEKNQDVDFQSDDNEW